MKAGKDIIEYDGRGIFPLEAETPEEFLKRAEETIGAAYSPDLERHARKTLRLFCNGFSIQSGDSRGSSLFESVYKKLEKKYSLNLRWVPIFFADLGNPFSYPYNHGLSSSPYTVASYPNTATETPVEIISPFVFINTEATRKKKKAKHELLHIPQITAFSVNITGMRYAQSGAYEERN